MSCFWIRLPSALSRKRARPSLSAAAFDPRFTDTDSRRCLYWHFYIFFFDKGISSSECGPVQPQFQRVQIQHRKKKETKQMRHRVQRRNKRTRGCVQKNILRSILSTFTLVEQPHDTQRERSHAVRSLKMRSPLKHGCRLAARHWRT